MARSAAFGTVSMRWNELEGSLYFVKESFRSWDTSLSRIHVLGVTPALWTWSLRSSHAADMVAACLFFRAVPKKA